jgi:hypothetical protein
MKFLVQSDNDYPSCQLLTALNARSFLTGRTEIMPNSKEFETLVDLTCCRYGSALRINKAYYYLRLVAQNGPNDNRWIYHRIQENRPVELSIWAPDFGYHSVLVIDITKNGSAIVINFKKRERISLVNWQDLDFPRYASPAKAFSLVE